MKDIHEQIIELGNVLKNQEAYQNLLKDEKIMEADQEVISLSINVNTLENDYNDLRKIYQENHDLVIKKQKELYQAKLKLDNHPLVKKYMEDLNQVNLPLRYLETNLLSKFISKRHKC
jgi:cell fate (sporulation/competence/biofilm development) regulator YlbF (YheA/YmcA/DUF963 family)